MTKKVKKYKHGGLHSVFDAPGMYIDDIKKYLKERPKKKDLKRLQKYKDMIMGGVPEKTKKYKGRESYRNTETSIGDMYDSKPKMKKGGSVKKKAVSSKRVKAHRGDGIAKRGRTRGRIV